MLNKNSFIKEVSIVIINYNTFELTKNTILGLIENTLELNYEVILVDNDSPDGSGEKLKELFGDKIVYIQAGGNLGTSKAFNLGLKKTGGKYVLWLNSDVEFKDNFIKKLFDYMENNPSVGVCGGNLVNERGKPIHSFRKELPSVKTIKKNYSVLFNGFNRVFKKPFFDQYNYSKKPLEVGYITGADMFVRHEIFDKIGGLDEDIFMYAEETEFQFRVRKLTDYKIYSVPWATLIHLEGQSFAGNGFSERRHKVSTEGMCIYLRKCFGEEAEKRYLRNLLKDCKKFEVILFPFNKLRKFFSIKYSAVQKIIEEKKQTE